MRPDSNRTDPRIRLSRDTIDYEGSNQIKNGFNEGMNTNLNDHLIN